MAEAVVRHHIELPLVELGLIFSNPSPSPINLSDIKVALISPGGERTPLTIEGIYDPVSKLIMPMPITTLDLLPSQKFPVRYSLFKQDLGWLGRIQELSPSIPNVFSIGLPDRAKNVIPPAVARAFVNWLRAEWSGSPASGGWSAQHESGQRRSPAPPCSPCRNRTPRA
ncbi:MAG: hypothetical protein ACKVS8_10970 [Phycisphaerales bacterium]